MTHATMVKASSIIGEKPHKNSKVSVSSYDFYKPDKLPQNKVNTISLIHTTFTTELSRRCSLLFNIPCRFELDFIDHISFAQYIDFIPDPSIVGICSMKPFTGNALLEINPIVGNTMLERLFGNKTISTADSNKKRAITHLESLVMKKVYATILEAYSESWNNAIPLTPELDYIETSARKTPIITTGQMTLIVSINTIIGNTRGKINICLPYTTLKPILNNLMSHRRSIQQKNETDRQSPIIDTGALQTDAEIFVETQPISLEQLSRLKKGSLLKLNFSDDHNISLSLNNETVLKLKPEKHLHIPYIFNVEKDTDSKTDSPLPSEATPANDKKTANNIILKSIEEMAAAINTRLTELSESINELYDRQTTALDQTYALNREITIIDHRSPSDMVTPFAYITDKDIEPLLSIMKNESDQCIAMLLSFLPPALSSAYFERLENDKQITIAMRISDLDKILSEIIEIIENYLITTFTELSNNTTFEKGGTQTLIDILGQLDRNTEKTIVKGLEKEYPALANEIKHTMFEFEDLLSLTTETLSIIFKHVENEDIVLALKAAGDEIKGKIFDALAEHDRNAIIEELGTKGPLEPKIVGEARARIIDIIKHLEEKGKIVIPTPGDTPP